MGERAHQRAALRPWQAWLIVGLPALFISLLPTSLQISLRYERDSVFLGEWWRLLSGHWVHLGKVHLFLNLAGLFLVSVFARHLTLKDWLLASAASLAAIDAGFLILDTQLQWYVGLSGLLHGLAIAGAVLEFRFERRESLFIGAALVAKLTYEQASGAGTTTSEWIGGAVVTNAHLYGALGGLAAALLLWRQHPSAPHGHPREGEGQEFTRPSA